MSLDSYGKWSIVKRGEMSARRWSTENLMNFGLGDLGWEFLDDATEIYGPTAGNARAFGMVRPSRRVAISVSAIVML